MSNLDSELQLLETLYSKQSEGSSVSQRELAGETGLSLGMTNALLKRFVERGWIKFTHLTGRSLSYILTPRGVEEILKRSVAYFTRAVRSASLYRERIDAFVHSLPERGISSVVLSGPGEFDFLFDYSCVRHGLQFYKNPQGVRLDSLLNTPSAVFVVAGFLSARDREVQRKDQAFCFPADAKASRVLLSRILFDIDEEDVTADLELGAGAP